MKVLKRTAWDCMATELIFYNEVYGPDGSRRIYVAKPVKLEFELIDPLEQIKEPTLTLTYEAWREFIPAIKQLVEDSKIPTESEQAAQSELRATKYHLEDVRKLLFKE